MRRTLGQLIVTAAIIDDTIGWIVLAIILGLAGHGRIDLASVGQSVFGTPAVPGGQLHDRPARWWRC